jgi:hypothetical protein
MVILIYFFAEHNHHINYTVIRFIKITFAPFEHKIILLFY